MQTPWGPLGLTCVLFLYQKSVLTFQKYPTIFAFLKSCTDVLIVLQEGTLVCQNIPTISTFFEIVLLFLNA